MATITLKAEPREVKGRATHGLREAGLVPVVVYGPKTEPTMATVNENELRSALKEAGHSSLVDLVIEGQDPVKVIIQDLQEDPVKDEFLHADLYQVDMTKKVGATVKLVFSGIAPAVKELGGTLVKARTTVEVKGLPDKLVPSLEVDLTKLATFDDVIHIKDITLPEGLEWGVDAERSVAVVNPPRTEEEMAALDEVPEEGELPEGAEEDKEGEEGEEGEEKKSEDGEGDKNKEEEKSE